MKEASQMIIKDKIKELLEQQWNSGYRKEVVFETLSEDIIKLFVEAIKGLEFKV